MKTDTATVTLHGITVEVEFEYSPAYRGKRDSLGAPEEPDEPASIEITAVRFESVDITDWVNEDTMKALEAEIWKGRE